MSRAFPGQFAKANRMAQTLAAEPYRAFHSLEPEAGVWEPTGFMDLAHVCWMLLEACGDASLPQYRGFESHSLFGMAEWRTRVQQYAQNMSELRLGDADVSAQNEHELDGIEDLVDGY